MARKNDVARFMHDVSPETCFWCSDGQVMRNMAELEGALRKMSAKTFRYHANTKKNDFSTWVRAIVGDTKLATDLRRSRDKNDAAKIVGARLTSLRRTTR